MQRRPLSRAIALSELLWWRVKGRRSYEQDELCTIDRDAGRIQLTRAGLLQVDSLLPAFFEPQFQGVRYT